MLAAVNRALDHPATQALAWLAFGVAVADVLTGDVSPLAMAGFLLYAVDRYWWETTRELRWKATWLSTRRRVDTRSREARSLEPVEMPETVTYEPSGTKATGGKR